jgi:hypothetical protein
VSFEWWALSTPFQAAFLKMSVFAHLHKSGFGYMHDDFHDDAPCVRLACVVPYQPCVCQPCMQGSAEDENASASVIQQECSSAIKRLSSSLWCCCCSTEESAGQFIHAGLVACILTLQQMPAPGLHMQHDDQHCSCTMCQKHALRWLLQVHLSLAYMILIFSCRWNSGLAEE